MLRELRLEMGPDDLYSVQVAAIWRCEENIEALVVLPHSFCFVNRMIITQQVHWRSNVQRISMFFQLSQEHLPAGLICAVMEHPDERSSHCIDRPVHRDRSEAPGVDSPGDWFTFSLLNEKS